jgi:hypothetical protein
MDYDYCSVISEFAGELVIECKEDVLFTQYGLFLDIPQDAGYNSVSFVRGYDVNDFSTVILISFYHKDNGEFIVKLPPLRTYAGQTVMGWNLTIFYYYYYNDTWYIQETDKVLMTDSWSQTGWYWTHGDMIPASIRLKPITAENLNGSGVSPSNPPAWNDFLGWINYLIYLLIQVGTGMGVALSVFVSAVGFLLQIAPYVLMIIPLHVLTSFMESPEKGISAINFYISVGRKIIDLMIKIIHAIVSIIDAIIPF